MDIHLLSDTHGHHGHYIMPGGDVLIHAGDVSGRGTPQAILNFINWFEMQDYVHRIWIPGNHDFDLERNFSYWKDQCDKRGITLLNDSGCTVQDDNGGSIKIWGSPITPWFHDWAFNRWPGKDIQKHWDLIPKDIEILITHGPPANILDACFTPPTYAEHVGCGSLSNVIKELKSLKLHVFGHIHEARGHEVHDNVLYVNASSLDQAYKCIEGVPYKIKRNENGIYSIE